MPFVTKIKKLAENKVYRILALLLLLALIPLGLYYYQYQKNQNLVQGSATSPAEVNSLVERVGKLIELPSGETPQIATVNDKTKLPNVPFFENARNGDKVLIYNQAKKAILYRPSTNKIINVAPVNIDTSSDTSQPPAATASASPTITATPTPTSGVTPILTPTPTQ